MKSNSLNGFLQILMDSTGITVPDSIPKTLKLLDRLNGFSSAEPAVFSGRKKYLRLQRNITLLMFCSAMIPLLLVELLFYFQYESPVRHSENPASTSRQTESDRIMNCFCRKDSQDFVPWPLFMSSNNSVTQFFLQKDCGF